MMTNSNIPEKDSKYVPFGFYKDLLMIVKSKMFYPVFISGHHGSGKTEAVTQACANAKREMIRVNLSLETDETDLVGGNTLIDGNVVFQDGPVVTALRRGQVLLLDEIDRARGSGLFSIMAILEGKPFLNKKTGEIVHPAPGFNIFATANTLGSGDDSGKYLSQIMDTAFLERFPITVSQNYPDNKTEIKILNFHCTDTEFVNNLVRWADITRKSYDMGSVDDFISTRRLIHIVKAYTIFNNKTKAIELCVNRFTSDTRNSFVDLYNKIDANLDLSDILENSEEHNDPF